MKWISFCLGLMWLTGCGAGATNEDDDGGVLDVRVERLPADPAYIEFYTPDGITIDPGEDKIYCFHTTYDGDDTGVDMFEAFQGKFGHHLLLMTTTELPEDPGTVEDCSSGEEYRHLRPVMFPNIEVPEGRAIFLKKGMPLVLHFHYANSGTKPILVQDLARLRKVDPNEVERWIAPMALASFDFSVDPFVETQAGFDCTVPRDLDLILVGGHMHALGTHFSLSHIEPGLKPLSIISEAWEPYYQWTPQIRRRYDDPWRLAALSTLRVECTWHNSSATPVAFPTEMCAAFGYVQDTTLTQISAPGWDNRVFFCEGELK